MPHKVSEESRSLFGSPPSRWHGGRFVARKKRDECQQLTRRAYRAIYENLGINFIENGMHSGPKISKATKVELVALVRVAARLYYDAQSARKIMDARTQATNENIFRKEQAA